MSEQNPQNFAPIGQLSTNRSLLKLILLSIITCGIYGLIVLTSIGNDINVIASRYDGKRTMHFCLIAFVLTPITFGIASIVWIHKISDRIGSQLQARGINYSFNATAFWLWGVLGSFIVIGPFIYYNKLLTAMNLLSEHYNTNG